MAALTARGSRVLRTRALPVVTSARREARAPHGFSHYLTDLETTSACGLSAQQPRERSSVVIGGRVEGAYLPSVDGLQAQPP